MVVLDFVELVVVDVVVVVVVVGVCVVVVTVVVVAVLVEAATSAVRFPVLVVAPMVVVDAVESAVSVVLLMVLPCQTDDYSNVDPRGFRHTPMALRLYAKKMGGHKNWDHFFFGILDELNSQG